METRSPYLEDEGFTTAERSISGPLASPEPLKSRFTPILRSFKLIAKISPARVYTNLLWDLGLRRKNNRLKRNRLINAWHTYCLTSQSSVPSLEFMAEMRSPLAQTISAKPRAFTTKRQCSQSLRPDCRNVFYDEWVSLMEAKRITAAHHTNLADLSMHCVQTMDES